MYWNFMGHRTLRRKLQKKLKHKPYRLCPACGQRVRLGLTSGDPKVGEAPWRLFKVCDVPGWNVNHPRACPMKGVKVELFWSGGVTGKRIPADDREVI